MEPVPSPTSSGHRSHPRRLNTLSTDLTDLKTSIASLSTVVARVQPVLQANADLNARVITVIENFLAATGSTITQADIDELTTSVQSTPTALQADAQNVAAQNAALQAELDKAAAATAQPAPVPTMAPPAPSA